MNKKLMLLAALALGGCTMTTGSNSALQASSWQLQGAADDTFTLQIADGKVAGKGGCNSYFGSITQQGDGVLTLSPMGSTFMMCPGDLAAKESEYLLTLEKVASYQIAGQQLILSDASKTALLTFNAKPVTK